MKQTAVSLLIHLYAWPLRLYPSGFRDEFGDEMTAQKGNSNEANL
jgi:hypothetical protein